ncbi:MAG: hypothetical protein WCB62_05405 [Pseudolabrys sp.]
MTVARTVIAALAAPLLSPAIQAISLYVRGVADANLVAKYFLTYLAAAAYLTPFMLGLPVHLVLWRLGWGGLCTYIVAGFSRWDADPASYRHHSGVKFPICLCEV